MSICPVTQHQCRCQPDEGIPCPYEAKMTNQLDMEDMANALEISAAKGADWTCGPEAAAAIARLIRASEPRADQWTPEEIARHTAHSPKPMVLPTIPTVASRGLAFDGIRWNVGHHLTCAAVQGTSDQCDCGAAEKSSEPEQPQLDLNSIERIARQQGVFGGRDGDTLTVTGPILISGPAVK